MHRHHSGEQIKRVRLTVGLMTYAGLPTLSLAKKRLARNPPIEEDAP